MPSIVPTSQAPAAGEPLPVPLGEPLPGPRRPLDDVRAITAPVPMLPLTAGPEPLTAAAYAPLTGLSAASGRTESARVALARARLRGVPVPDAVIFVAACPGCGQDAQWHEEREDTRLRVTINCDC